MWNRCALHTARCYVIEMNKPMKSDWGTIDKNDLDAQSAYKHFAGISSKEAEELFKYHALYYQEDLLSMPAIAFNYYAPVFTKYLLSNDAIGDSDGASSFMHMIIEILKSFRTIATPETMEILLSTAQQVSIKQEFYDADVDIYGKFTELQNRIEQLAGST